MLFWKSLAINVVCCLGMRTLLVSLVLLVCGRCLLLSCSSLLVGLPGVCSGSPFIYHIHAIPRACIDRNFHCYAYNTPSVPLKSGITYVSLRMCCLAEINSCMFTYFLQLNDSTSEIMTLSGPSSSSVNNLSCSLGALSINSKNEAHKPRCYY